MKWPAPVGPTWPQPVVGDGARVSKIGLSRASAYRFAASGVLPTRRLGGRVYVITAKLVAFINGEPDLA